MVCLVKNICIFLIFVDGTDGSQIHIWIDLVNDVTWAYSGESATFTNWRDGQPRDGKEACTTLNSVGTWNDVPCDANKDVLCEEY